MRRTAFTLIELLLAAAIVAILAGILFPVFTPARRENAKADSLQNVRAITIGALMYTQDFDGGIPLMVNGPMRSMANIRDGQKTKYGEERSDGWPLMVMPYLESRKTLVDPTRGDLQGIWSGPPLAEDQAGFNALKNTYRNQSRYPMYGLNYLYLCPFRILDSDMTIPYPTDQMRSEGHTIAEADDPVNTVFFTATVRGFVGMGSGILDSSRGFFGVNAPGLFVNLAASTSPYVAMWSGTNCSGDFCGDAVPTTQGQQRRTNFVFPGNSGSTPVSFLDGHVATMTDVDLAAGTDYLNSTPRGPEGAEGGGCTILDKSKYIWNLNENFFGA